MKTKFTKFHNACLRLTLFYVLIIMLISVCFSISIFRISTNELSRGLGRQTRVLQDIPTDQLSDPFQSLEQIRQNQLNESENRLKLNLFYFNLLILVLSSTASYFLARKTLAPIEEAMEAQNRFTADASHELRTPLTVMKTEIEVSLRDSKLDLEESKKLLHSNLEEISKLETLANALLKLARNDSAKLSFRDSNLTDIITDAYTKIDNLAEKKKIKIDFDNHVENEKALIQGDSQSLTELFVIILDNAVKYSPANTHVNISLEKDKDNLIVKIKDQGIGIKASDIPYIFNRFYRADSSRCKTNISGYGLGLSIAKQIVELHDGKISASSKAGEGSEFKITFNAKKLN